ncbi:hypothetical protein [Flavobacterium sp.]|uniref:hypothetical protein n=1 Tax=Flavobacterium sp. TaxID=239 RepID=UPI0040331DFB
MDPELLKKIQKIAVIADKVSKFAKMGSMATKGILINKEITKWSKDGHRVQTLLKRGMENDLSVQLKMTEFLKSTPDFISHYASQSDAVMPKTAAVKYYGGGLAEPIDSIGNSGNIISQTKKLSKFYGGGLPTDILHYYDNGSIGKDLRHLDFLAEVSLQEIKIKKKIETKLIDEIKSENFDLDRGYNDPILNIDAFQYLSMQKHIDALNSVVLAQIVEDPVRRRPPVLDWSYLRAILELLELNEEIKERQKFIVLVKSFKKLLCSVFRQFQINRRESFRKINSIIFKNLDDYHSLALTSAGY